MRKSLTLLSGILLVAITIVVFLYMKINKPYSEIININWSIKLPNSYKEIYSVDSGKSFHGDGERYHVFQYKRKDDIDLSLDWEDNRNSEIEAEVKRVLNNLNVSNDNMPDFQSNYKYYITGKNDSSRIYLIFVPDTKILYIIEDIY